MPNFLLFVLFTEYRDIFRPSAEYRTLFRVAQTAWLTDIPEDFPSLAWNIRHYSARATDKQIGSASNDFRKGGYIRLDPPQPNDLNVVGIIDPNEPEPIQVF